MIEVVNLKKSFGDTEAVRSVSFRGAKGDVIGFLGPNGAGKTTTLKMLTTILPPSGGEAKLNGHSVTAEAEEVRRSIGFLPDNPALQGEFTVREFLRFIAELRDVPKKELRAVVDGALERCSITDVPNKLCSSLSRGYRQRVGLAAALLHKPKVLILDEPTSGLDPKQIRAIRELIKSLSEEHTVLLSTHILAEVQMVCSKVVIINQGYSVFECASDSLPKEKSLEELFLEFISKDASHFHSSKEGGDQS